MIFLLNTSEGQVYPNGLWSLYHWHIVFLKWEGEGGGGGLNRAFTDTKQGENVYGGPKK